MLKSASRPYPDPSQQTPRKRTFPKGHNPGLTAAASGMTLYFPVFSSGYRTSTRDNTLHNNIASTSATAGIQKQNPFLGFAWHRALVCPCCPQYGQFQFGFPFPNRSIGFTTGWELPPYQGQWTPAVILKPIFAAQGAVSAVVCLENEQGIACDAMELVGAAFLPRVLSLWATRKRIQGTSFQNGFLRFAVVRETRSPPWRFRARGKKECVCVGGGGRERKKTCLPRGLWPV
ncbi:hypothetical protein BaRGS_00008446 [Batillaria attramentaria]|uniref:Uncharacterized protein n=1 Tax=Batillaria attramentaria TaxID=370345 RepID=A0ABD0LMJ1_9CAEN